jgi:predicted branched-subunit amino acid permease
MARKNAIKAMMYLIIFAGVLCIVSLNFLIQGIPIIRIGVDSFIINSLSLFLSLIMLVRTKIELIQL